MFRIRFEQNFNRIFILIARVKQFNKNCFNFISMVNPSTLIPILTVMTSAWSRAIGNTFKTLPAVTNSLVNLGKMDYAFYLNVHPEDLNAFKSAQLAHQNLFSPKIETGLEPCPCSSLRYVKDATQNRPTDQLKKILSGNELFTFKEPASSPLCCSSHEHVQEDIILEFNPKQKSVFSDIQSNIEGFPFLPYLLDTLQSKPNLPTMPVKPKAIEILFFPKKSGVTTEKSSNLKQSNIKNIKNNTIKIVGDKEVKNEIKSGIYAPPRPSTIIKDLSQEKDKIVSNIMEQANTIDENKIKH